MLNSELTPYLFSMKVAWQNIFLEGNLRLLLCPLIALIFSS